MFLCANALCIFEKRDGNHIAIFRRSLHLQAFVYSAWTGESIYFTMFFSLTFPSGGIRGVVELEVLRALGSALPHDIPIRAFFDLMVGTRSVNNLSLYLGFLYCFRTMLTQAAVRGASLL